MKVSKIVLVALVWTSILVWEPLTAFAESHVGNGGHEVICGQKRYLLDVFETSTEPNYRLDFQGSDYSYKVQYALTKLLKYRLDPDLFTQLREYFGTVMNSSRKYGTPAPTGDMGTYNIPTDCMIGQLVTQTVLHGRSFIFSTDWQRLDPTNQAATILHEILYAYALNNGHTTSERTRKFVRFLMSDLPSKISHADYIKFRNSLSFDNHHKRVNFLAENVDDCEIGLQQNQTRATNWCNAGKLLRYDYICTQSSGVPWLWNVESEYICSF